MSIVTSRFSERAPILSAASVAVAVNRWAPSVNSPVSKLQLPLPSAIAVPSTFGPSNTVTVTPASAVPVNVSVVSEVMPSAALPVSSEIPTMIGAEGPEVSISTVKASEASPVFPAMSVAIAVKSCKPSSRLPVVKLHAPAPSATAVPSWVAPSNIATLAPASAVPVKTSVVSEVTLSPCIPVSSEKPEMTGAEGATVSTSTAKVPDAGLAFPATSVAVAVNSCTLSSSSPVAKLQRPVASATVVPIDVSPSKISIVAPASAVPVNVSIVSEVMPSPVVPVSAE